MSHRRDVVATALLEHTFAYQDTDYTGAWQCICGHHTPRPVDMADHVADQILAALDQLEDR